MVVFIQNEGEAPTPASAFRLLVLLLFYYFINSTTGLKIVVACFAGGLSLYTSVPRLRSIITRLGGELMDSSPDLTRMTHYVCLLLIALHSSHIYTLPPL